ncbi:allose kinase [Anaerotaenia torta]|uniref:allose kinase n=1 Tax=Anaerotaenia torta TaxID=433293 RepID=UPI003D1BF154
MRIKCVIGLDIGGTYCRMGIVDRLNKLYHPYICSITDLQSDNHFINGLMDFIESYMEMHQKEFDIQAISMGFPSTIDHDRRVLLSTPNIDGLDNIPIVDLCEERFRIPVYINRDVNMLMYHDLDNLEIPKGDLTLGFYIGTGFGNAIYINDEILLGKHGVAGELGHMPTLGSKKKCSCGNEGCIEAIAAGRYLEELCRTKFAGTNIKDIYVKHGDTEKIREQVEYLSIPIATEINIFDPDHIILGGGILQMEGFPKKLLEEFIIKHSRKPYPAYGLHILYARDEQENGIIGAGLYGYHRLNAEKKKLLLAAD